MQSRPLKFFLQDRPRRLNGLDQLVARKVVAASGARNGLMRRRFHRPGRSTDRLNNGGKKEAQFTRDDGV
jgi:hypothetical protein